MTQAASPQLEIALRELTKLIKAVQYYPPGHPATQGAASDARAAFLPLLAAGNNLTCTVRKEGISHEDHPVGASNQVLQKLSAYLFARRVQHLVILPDLSILDLVAFGRALSVDPAETRRQGGIKELLLKAQVTTVWVNETDLSRILAQKEEIETAREDAASGFEELPTATGPADSERDLKTVLNELRVEQDGQRYRALLQELVPLARLQMTGAGRLVLLQALALLCQLAADRGQETVRREFALHALHQLAEPELVDFLIDGLCEKELAEQHRKLLTSILVFLKQRAISRLMERLAQEKSAGNRKQLSMALSRQGAQAIPLLAEYLLDERWYVVRNAATILGEIRDPAAARHLNPLLHHDDIRVCREAIRALTRIGGKGAAQILLDVINDEDDEISRQAILSLGVIGDESAVPGLVKIVREGDFFCKQIGRKKDTIRALGEIGSSEALPPLHTLLSQKRLFKRHEHRELRVAAAQAIGEIGDPVSAQALEKATHDRSPEVARQAAQAMRQLPTNDE